MSSAGSTVPEGDGHTRTGRGIWAIPLIVLFGVWLWLAFSSGGYIPRNWLLPSVTLGFVGLIVALLAVYPRRPRQLSLLVLSLFALYTLWVMVSALWADSTTGVWLESGRTLTYLLVFALAAIYLTDTAARRGFRYVLMAASLILLVAVIWKLWSSNDVASMFMYSRLSYPVTYPNNAAALLLIGFWPLMWLAAGREEAAPVRGVALGLATGLLGLAIMTQSRGAIWSLGFSVVFMFAVSPARLRTLLYLLVPGLLMVYEFPQLNRYWEEGAQSVGGAPGARSLVMISVVAAFVGMILALLERWINVSQRMRVIFGSVVVAGVIALVVYGSITLTAETGGPLKWVAQTWEQFTESSESDSSDTESASRFTMLGSNGRVGIWRVAWREFEAEPALGVGANSFVFGYDRLRTSETSKPQNPHSLFLQVVAETGVVGGIIFVGSVLLVLGGLLWPRCAAGWLRARGTWLRPSRPVNRRLCNPRWGNEPASYGWQMALLVAMFYWLVHGSVEWLWQMAGVTIPAFLILAAALAEVDARAEVVWPRWGRRLRVAPPSAGASPEAVPEDEVAASIETSVELQAGPPSTSAPQLDATADRRTLRRRQRSERSTSLQPPGLLSMGFRFGLVVFSLLLVIGTGLPYLALRYEESARALAKTDGIKAVERAASAHWLQPADPSPYLTQASIYENAARRAIEADTDNQPGVVLDNLALAIDACERAIELEPADWSIRYRAGVSALNLLMATEYLSGRTLELDIDSLVKKIPGFIDCSGLAPIDYDQPPEPGQAEGSLAGDETTQAVARHYLNMPTTELGKLALSYLEAAKERNPLASQIGEAMAVVDQVLGPRF